MFFYLYEQDEKEYHELDSLECHCQPCLLPCPTGGFLILHQKLVDIENPWTEEDLRDAFDQIDNCFLS